ncbi:NUDIX hydrolase [Vibrio sp. WXL103]|uniref:NUDIX hydrolase n=1 Tax=unclassified Vibrio TaxID=2614977 RepID=UPI003EC635B1
MSRLIHQWKSIRLEQEEVVLPNGKQITHTNIQHPGAAVVLPINAEGEIVVVNQYRPSLKKWLLELPAGTIEEGESPLACAQRELLEETGFVAEQFLPLGQVTPMAGFCDEIQHLFVAKGASAHGECALDDDEIIQVETISVERLQELIKTNQLTDAKTIACLSKAQLCGYL